MSKLYLITGGSGFLGVELIDELLKRGDRVRIMARDEGKMIPLQNRVDIYPGDVCDPFEVQQAMKGVDGVFHLAASKHVGLAETFVREAVKTNIIGSLNIFEQSLKQPLEFVISISTDKAAQVAGVYGATKLIMERLSQQYQQLNPECKYRIVRYGNVLYSTGSVLCKWKENMQAGRPIIVTDQGATRFFWTRQDAVKLIFDCLENAQDSKPYCPEMKSIRIGDLLYAMMYKYGEVYVKEIGLQPGENKHEKVIEDGLSSDEAEKYSLQEIKEMI